MAIGPNDKMVAVCCEVVRLEKEFDNAISMAKRVSVTEESGNLTIGIYAKVPVDEILELVAARLERNYEYAGWSAATLIMRDDSSMALSLLK